MGAGIRGRRPVLVVDDETSVASFLSKLLRRNGYQVVVVHSCVEVQFLQGSFLLGIFDINLGDGCGVHVAKRLIEEERLSGCVFVTGFAEVDVIQEAETLGRVFQKGDGLPGLIEHVNKIAGGIPSRE